MVFAKKAKSDNIEGGLYQSDIYSYTYQKKVTLIASKDWIKSTDKVLICLLYTSKRGYKRKPKQDTTADEAAKTAETAKAAEKTAAKSAAKTAKKPATKAAKKPAAKVKPKAAQAKKKQE